MTCPTRAPVSPTSYPRPSIPSRDKDRLRRLELLQKNDFEAYHKLLRQQAMGSEGIERDERYNEINKFVRHTENYVEKMVNKVINSKLQKAAQEAADAEMTKLKDSGLPAAEIIRKSKEVAAQAALALKAKIDETKDLPGIQTRFNALAHMETEVITREPAFLRPPNGASLRNYQMAGLQWMVSLYNSGLNGILADEMVRPVTEQIFS